jgi:hypothetical protein
MFVKKIIGEQEKHVFVASKKDENPRRTLGGFP